MREIFSIINSWKNRVLYFSIWYVSFYKYKGAANFFHLVITDSYSFVLTYLVELLKAKYFPFLITYSLLPFMCIVQTNFYYLLTNILFVIHLKANISTLAWRNDLNTKYAIFSINLCSFLSIYGNAKMQ